jgi:hypothetical protein
MRRAVVGSLLAMAALSAETAQAEEAKDRSGEWLLQACGGLIRAIDEDIPPSTVEGMMNGHFCSGLSFGLLIGMQSELRICTPDGVQNPQAIRVIHRFLKDHPERLHESGAGLAGVALANAFPCPRKE